MANPPNKAPDQLLPVWGETSPLNLARFKIWIFLFFFISGFTGLIYQMVWTRLLTLVLGNTHYSIATVLTTFMAGLGLGSFFGGRWVDRPNPSCRRNFAWALPARSSKRCSISPPTG